MKHIPLDGRIDSTPEQLADETIPSPEDIQALIAVHNDIAPCRERAIEDFSQIIPAMIPAAVEGYQVSDLILADLIQRKITWGEANRRRMVLRREATSKALSAQAHAEALERQAEAESRQAIVSNVQGFLSGALKIALASLSAWSIQQRASFYSQPTPYGMNRMVITNCSAMGGGLSGASYIHCSSY
ncbi:hypothetical protein MishRS11D_24690 [Methylomagnum ishizawai]|nr:hypothetical protein MishRS11D_24690 [Methylomagnum ishizawai]